MRELVSVVIISDIQPIPDADNIEVASVKGWKVVVKKGDFSIGDAAIYFEVDSWIPQELTPFLCKEPYKVFQGVSGALLRTIKLRGQISQGLLLPIKYVNDYLLARPDYLGKMSLEERLGVIKYEKPEDVSGQTVGKPFPHFIQKTDQPRIQNLDIADLIGEYQVTEKLDGSSMTVFKDGVCSRNRWLTEDENNFTRVVKEFLLQDVMKASGLNIALQGELVGPKIQGNSYDLRYHDFYCFSIFDIDKQKYWKPDSVEIFCDEFGVNHVPVVSNVAILSSTNIDELLAYADRKSFLNPNANAEGLVFKSVSDQRSFKVISNKWLLKQK